MKKNHIYYLLLACVISLFVVSCSDDSIDDTFDYQNEIDNSDQGLTTLGQKLEIPFTVENMQRAYESLRLNPTASKYPRDFEYFKNENNSAQSGNYQITTTHYYVKFSPQDSLQYETIANDSILAVSDTPFEYEVDTAGAKYQDPDYANTDLTYYYSVTPVEYTLPTNINYEILANLHFTKEDLIEASAPESELQKVDFFHDLNTEALKLTDNLKEEKEELRYLFTNSQGVVENLNWSESQTRGLNLDNLIINFNEDDYPDAEKFRRRRRWNPSGTITVAEDALNNQSVGVMGAFIRVRKWGWLVIKTAHTNRVGFFRTSSTRTKRVKYALYYKTLPFHTVKAGTFFWDARDRGHATHKRRAWRRHYTYGRRQFYAYIQNAAFDYYTRIVGQYNIRRPRLFTKLSAKYNLCASSRSRPHWAPLHSEIRITRRQSSCRYRNSDGIYATTVHELTHSGHRTMDAGMFSLFHSGSNTRNLMQESWAEGVEIQLVNERYNSLSANYNSTDPRDIALSLSRWGAWRQRRTAIQMNEYTPIVDDLIDNFNQRNIAPVNTFPVDLVDGYNLNQIQAAINNCRDIECWEAKLNNVRPTGVTTNELNELFNYVRAVRNNAGNWN